MISTPSNLKQLLHRDDPLEDVHYWRNRIVFLVARISLILGGVPISVSTFLSLRDGLYLNIVFDAIFLVAFVFLLFTKTAPYLLRAGVLVAILYISGTYFTAAFGPIAVGFYILFVTPIMAAVLLSKRLVHLVFAVNSLTVVFLAVVNLRGIVDWPWNFPPGMAVLFLLTFLFFSALVTYTIAEIVGGLHAVNEHLAESRVDLKAAYIEIISRLVTAVDCRDEVTGAHALRIGNYSALLAARYGFDRETTEQLYYASLMHDIGKIGIPDVILKSTHSLSEKERLLINRHTISDAAILAGSETPVLQMAERVAMCHHEKWNGSGYPRGLEGTDIPIEARIVAICDTFDVITSARRYKNRQSTSEATAIIAKGRGTDFDPELVDLFLHYEDEFLSMHDELNRIVNLSEAYTGFYQFRDRFFKEIANLKPICSGTD